MARVRLAGDVAGYVELNAPSTAGNNTLTLPTSNGSTNQGLLTDGSGNLFWNDVLLTSGSVIPTGVTFASGLTSSGNVTLNTQNSVRFADADSSNWVAFKAPATINSNITWTLPSGDGSSGQFIKTDGSGSLSWGEPPSPVTKSMAYFYAGF